MGISQPNGTDSPIVNVPPPMPAMDQNGAISVPDNFSLELTDTIPSETLLPPKQARSAPVPDPNKHVVRNKGNIMSANTQTVSNTRECVLPSDDIPNAYSVETETVSDDSSSHSNDDSRV